MLNGEPRYQDADAPHNFAFLLVSLRGVPGRVKACLKVTKSIGSLMAAVNIVLITRRWTQHEGIESLSREEGI